MSKDVKIRVGTRTSKLALAQATEVYLLLFDQDINIKVEIIPINTSGDKIQDKNLADFGGKGLFIKELEEALIEDKIDIAVHSAKDTPPVIHQDTIIAAFTERKDARDCLISKKFNSISSLPKNAIVGTSSARRKAILLKQRPDLKIVNFRGNIDTRLLKIENEDVDASILSLCGLERIEKHNCAKQIIEKNEMLPSGGQGSLAIQVRKNDDKILNLVKKINHKETSICIESERSFLENLGASCSTPVAVHSWIDGDKLYLKTMILDYDGSQHFETNSSALVDLKEGIKLGLSMANKTKKEAAELLKKIKM